MKKKTVIIVSVIIVIAMLAAIIIPLLSKAKTGEDTSSPSEEAVSESTGTQEQSTKNDSTEPEGTDTQEQPTEEESAATEDTNTQEQPTEDTETPEQSTEGTSSDTTSPSESESGGQGGSAETSESTSEKESQSESETQATTEETSSTAPVIPEIAFPYAIPESDLIIEKVVSYDGYYIEDASDAEISGIAAVVVTNTGGDISFAGIGISQGSRSLGFSASQVPAGATIIIQEQTKAPYTFDPYYSATATITRVEHFEMSEDLVTLEDNGDHTLSVTNISGKNLSEVTILFKNYLPEEKVYVGGLTYTIKLKDVEPNTITSVSASHYDSIYSVVVEVKVKQ